MTAKGKTHIVPAIPQTKNLAIKFIGVNNNPAKQNGIALSTTSKSLENLFKSLPSGTLSKKRLTGALIILVNILLCSFLATPVAFIIIRLTLIKIKIPEVTPITV